MRLRARMQQAPHPYSAAVMRPSSSSGNARALGGGSALAMDGSIVDASSGIKGFLC